ncbi:tautomerase family protein [Deinococcus ruber]|uniref:tautomerase family protein n=1 Tax=Deinococcus ruber TaxID=1848197 RepID=UPI00166B816D|nr:tautomerase family protein [Deinococcus ruber]
MQITCNAGRSTEKKRALYARMAQLLSEHAGIAPADLVISLIELHAENWSFAHGLMP